MTVKVCSRCTKKLDISLFNKKKHGKFGVEGFCKECSKQKTYAYRRNIMTPESKYAIARKSNLKSKYGMTLEDYSRMFDRQGGLCAICLKPEKQSKLLAVDHNHKNGKVRGLLCSVCNTAIGKLEDDPKRLQRAIDYILADGGKN